MASLKDMVCLLCPPTRTSFLHLNFPEYLKHMELFHCHHPDFSITCGVGGCLRTFKNLRTFRNHVSGFHSDEGIDNLDNTDNIDGIDNTEDTEDYDDDRSGNLDSAEEHGNLKRFAAMFLLKIKEKHKLTQIALQGIIEGVTMLFQGHLNVICDKVCRKLVMLAKFLTLKNISIHFLALRRKTNSLVITEVISVLL